MKKISVVISAYNEEVKIRECLESIKWADEIIFVDNSSSDKTKEIAKEYTSKIYVQPNNPMLNINKNYGISKASNEWILVLDADERVSPSLRDEINIILNDDTDQHEGYWIPRKNIIFGRWIKHMGWYPDYQLRLVRKDKGKFAEKNVHEMIDVKGNTAYLKKDLVHYNYENVAQFLKKHIFIYAPNEAEDLLRKGYDFSWKDAIRFPLSEFLSRYFAREGYKEGFYGLVISLLMSFYHLTIFAYIWEKRGFENVNIENAMTSIEKEFRKSYKETMFWFLSERNKETKNMLKRMWMKSKQRFYR